ncbi:MAG: hypothetical protein U5R48_13515 [Gammaproteobacteria bacterium]|nr:hypothetical protein [Gammaproteobacteria bacterium]
MGVFPIRDHYYEPKFDHRNPRLELSQDRDLPGIDWNIPGQLNMLDVFNCSEELSDLPGGSGQAVWSFHLNNGAFESGDAEYWYQIIRAIKPKQDI